MEELLSEAVVISASLIPILLIIVQLLKQAEINNKWLPHISTGLGVIAGIAFAIILNEPVAVYAVAGFVGGAGASGVFDIAKVFTRG